MTRTSWVELCVSDLEQSIGRFLLDLERDTLDDEAYLRICRETGRTFDLVDRLLALGRVDEAARATQSIDGGTFLELANLFTRHGQDAVAERLVKERLEQQTDLRLLNWLQTFYRARGNHIAELAVAEMAFRAQPFLKGYQELRELARPLHRWDSLRASLLSFLEQSQHTSLLIQIALEEGDIDQALHRLKGTASKDIYGTTYTVSPGYSWYGNMALEVARAAEEARPREARELYRQYAERLIAQRGRHNYQEACKYLLNIRTLDEQLGESDAWMAYITTLREQNRNLRALREELAHAGL